MNSFTWTTWPEGLAHTCPLNHTQLDKLIYATKCACTVHIRQPRTHEATYTWQHVTPMHAQVPVWYVHLKYERNHTWLDCIFNTNTHSSRASSVTTCSWTLYVHVAGIKCLHVTALTMYCIWPCVLDCIHVFMFTSGHHSCCTDLAITSRKHCRQLSDLRYFETNALFTLSTHK